MKEIRAQDDCDSSFYCEEPEAKGDERKELERLTAAFLANSKITYCKPGPKPNFRFGSPRPPLGSVGTNRENDLTRRRWRTPKPSFGQERDLIRQARSGDDKAKQKLLEAIGHRQILRIAKRYSGPPHNEIMAAGLLGFCEAIEGFNLASNSGELSTYAEYWIKKRISGCIRAWRGEGIKDESNATRYLFSNSRATAEEIVTKIGGTIKNAEEAIERLNSASESYDERQYDDDERQMQQEPLSEMRNIYSCFNPYSLSSCGAPCETTISAEQNREYQAHDWLPISQWHTHKIVEPRWKVIDQRQLKLIRAMMTLQADNRKARRYWLTRKREHVRHKRQCETGSVSMSAIVATSGRGIGAQGLHINQ
jgi:hypothetical protein